MDHNQLVTYVEYSIVLGVLIGFLLHEIAASFFEKNKDFKVAKMEELPEGEYTVLDIKPRGDSNEIFIIKLRENGKSIGHLMAVYLDHSLYYLLKDQNKGKVLSFSLSHEKHSCLIKINSLNDIGVVKVLTFKKTFDQYVCGVLWETTSQVFD